MKIPKDNRRKEKKARRTGGLGVTLISEDTFWTLDKLGEPPRTYNELDCGKDNRFNIAKAKPLVTIKKNINHIRHFQKANSADIGNYWVD